jgi:hypothetical protein
MGVSAGTNGISVYEHAGGYMPPILVYSGSVTGWNHAAVVYTDKRPKLYLNGVLVRTGLLSNMIYIHPYPLYIGNMTYGSFSGKIDEFRIWNRSLSATEISTLSLTGELG